eukprot:m.124192 g.124192  ORF g.124192 m.124192 type:complete len:75 (-) comp16616_c1_seq4:88-312(-)
MEYMERVPFKAANTLIQFGGWFLCSNSGYDACKARELGRRAVTLLNNLHFLQVGCVSAHTKYTVHSSRSRGWSM